MMSEKLVSISTFVCLGDDTHCLGMASSRYDQAKLEHRKLHMRNGAESMGG